MTDTPITDAAAYEVYRGSTGYSGERVDADDMRKLEREKAELEAKLAEKERDLKSALDHIEKDDTEIASLNAKLAEAEKDAERYRWMREYVRRHWRYGINQGAADAAIDKAMKDD